MTYQIEIRETLSRIVEIDAATAADAMQEVRRRHQCEEVILSADDFAGVDFIVQEDC